MNILHLKAALNSYIDSVNISEYLDEVTINISDKEKLKDIICLLKSSKETQCQILVDICAEDYPQKAKRFNVVYHFLSLSLNIRLRVKVNISQNEKVPTIKDIYKCADWYEREIWDMYGIVAEGNEGQKDIRILTDDNFEGFPLRKDFPVFGDYEVKYNERYERIEKIPVHLKQEYREFYPSSGKVNDK